jgi:foldase protein PrsA
MDQVDMLKNYYREYKGTDFTNDEGKALLSEIRTEVIDRLIEDQIVAKEAKRLNINLSKEEIDNGFNELVTANGGNDEFATILNKYYKLTMDEFKTKIYRTQMVREKVAEAINSDQAVLDAAKKQADEVYAKTQAAGADFAALAGEYSQDTATAASGGDLGYFKKGTMVTEFEDAAFALKKGQISQPIKTVYGYHIIKVVDLKGDEIKASHILLKIRDYNEWLEGKTSELKAKKYVGFIPGIWKLIKTD